jgi:hypothetical protein
MTCARIARLLATGESIPTCQQPRAIRACVVTHLRITFATSARSTSLLNGFQSCVVVTENAFAARTSKNWSVTFASVWVLKSRGKGGAALFRRLCVPLSSLSALSSWHGLRAGGQRAAGAPARG